MGLSAKTGNASAFCQKPRSSFPQVKLRFCRSRRKHCRQNDPHRKCLHRCRDITRKPGRKPDWLLVCAFLIGSGLSWRASGFLRKAAAGLAAILPAKLARPVCCCKCTYCGQPFRNGISYAGCGRDPSVPDGLFRTGAGFDLFVYDVLWAGKRDAVCAAAFRHGTEKGNVASAACISACGSCFCRAVHARHRFSAGEQPDPRLFLFCSRA